MPEKETLDEWLERTSGRSCPTCGGELGTALAIGRALSDRLHVCLQCAALVRAEGAGGVVVDPDALALSPAERDAVNRAIELVRRDRSRVNEDKANR